jgi:hypothetical protein
MNTVLTVDFRSQRQFLSRGAGFFSGFDRSGTQLPLPAIPGHPVLMDDEYVRNGVASIFIDVGPERRNLPFSLS